MKKTNTTKTSNMLVNIFSEVLKKNTGISPSQIRIRSDFNDKNQTITHIKNGIEQLYPNMKINEIFTNDNINFENVQQDMNNNIMGFSIYINALALGYICADFFTKVFFEVQIVWFCFLSDPGQRIDNEIIEASLLSTNKFLTVD